MRSWEWAGLQVGCWRRGLLRHSRDANRLVPDLGIRGCTTTTPAHEGYMASFGHGLA